MNNDDYNLEREIEEGLARTERMLRRKKIYKIIGWIVLLSIGGIILFMMGNLAISGYSKYQAASAEKTATARPRQTATALVHQKETATQQVIQLTESVYSTATQQAIDIQSTRAANTAKAQVDFQAEKTATAVARKTVTAKAQETATAKAVIAQTSTVEALEEFSAAVEENSIIVFGPEDGSLEHKEDDYVETESAYVDLSDFIVSVKFFNPYRTTIGPWDYGLLFRNEGSNEQYRLVITSQGDWELLNHTGDSDGKTILFGELSNLDTSSNGSNTIKVIAQGGEGFLYVNSVFVAKLDLSERMNSGGISVATGLYNGNEIDGYSTRYGNFTIWNTSLATGGDYEVKITSHSVREGKAPLDINLSADLVLQNGESLCKGNTKCDFTWVAYYNSKDVLTLNKASFYYTFENQGNYTILVTICFDARCETSQTSVVIR